MSKSIKEEYSKNNAVISGAIKLNDRIFSWDLAMWRLLMIFRGMLEAQARLKWLKT